MIAMINFHFFAFISLFPRFPSLFLLSFFSLFWYYFCIAYDNAKNSIAININIKNVSKCIFTFQRSILYIAHKILTKNIKLKITAGWIMSFLNKKYETIKSKVKKAKSIYINIFNLPPIRYYLWYNYLYFLVSLNNLLK